MSESPETPPTAHVLIVGGGASGTTCALFLARAGISSTIFDHDRTILKRAYLHNYPGSDPILGVDWLAHLRGTLAATGLSTQVDERVTAVAVNGASITATTDTEEVSGEYLVIASGQVNIAFADDL